MSLWCVWLIAAAILLVLEVLSGFVAAFCLAIGCLAALVADLVGCSVSAQMWVALICTVISFFAFPPLIKKWHQKIVSAHHGPVSNMEALVGRRVRIVTPIEAGATGRVMIDGDNWQVRCLIPQRLESGTYVRVVGNESIVLIVTPDIDTNTNESN